MILRAAPTEKSKGRCVSINPLLRLSLALWLRLSFSFCLAPQETRPATIVEQRLKIVIVMVDEVLQILLEPVHIGSQRHHPVGIESFLNVFLFQT